MTTLGQYVATAEQAGLVWLFFGTLRVVNQSGSFAALFDLKPFPPHCQEFLCLRMAWLHYPKIIAGSHEEFSIIQRVCRACHKEMEVSNLGAEHGRDQKVG